MSDPNTIDPEYNEFLKVFDGCWPTNYEFFLAACNWQKQKNLTLTIPEGWHRVGIVENASNRERRCGAVLWHENVDGLPNGTIIYAAVPKHKESE